MRFEKWQGLGNHHVVVEREHLPRPIDAERARALCDPHFGIGADGVLEVSWEGERPRMTVWNADGTTAENCGNGIRIVARFLHDTGRLPDDGVVLTGGEVTRVAIGVDGLVSVDMGEARFPAGERRETLDLGGTPLAFVEVSMGNPHAVIEVPPDQDPADAMARYGAQVEVEPRFPGRVNAEFVRVDGPGEATVRVWERGVGPTMACGTGACAVAAALVRTRGAGSPVTVNLPGGSLRIDVGDSMRVVMTGPAERVFRGEWAGEGW